ncbi:MAG: HAD-IA family hydrolase [Hyphomicrobiales bacterium]|nr:HAD-IA family hydrolase [Hyphomicrobiales bacterium]
MTQPLLIFDLDGTLAETAGDLMATLNHVLASEGIAPVPTERARYLVGAGAKALLMRGFAAQGQTLEGERLERLYTAFLNHYDAHIADQTFLFPGVVAAMDRFEAAGWGLAVCTNKVERPARKLLEALGVAHRFRAIVGQDTFGVAKPDPRILEKTIQSAGGSPARAVMVGDSRADIETARGLGVPVVAVDFGYTDTPVTELGPDRVISHFDALWDAVQAVRAARV